MTNIVQAYNGAMIKPGPMVTVVPERSVNDDELAAFAEGSGLNGPFVADFLSACVAHDRMGVNLYKMLAANTGNPVIEALMRQLQTTAEAAVHTWEKLIGDLGGNHLYASPIGRMTEGMDTKIIESFLLSGSAEPLPWEAGALNAAFAAECICVANTETLGSFAEKADEGHARSAMQTAADTLIPSARMGQKMVREAMDKANGMQAKSGLLQKAAAITGTVTATVKNKLS